MAFSIVKELSQTIEVFEKVLLHLTHLDLLHSQRASRYWFDIINKSPVLQQKLFFQPYPTSEASRREQPEFNPLVKPIFPFLFDPQPFPGPNLRKDDIEKATARWANDTRRRDAILRPEASWRRMLPIQPAAPIDAVLNGEWCCVGGISLEYCEIDTSQYNQAPNKVGPSVMVYPDLDLKTCATVGLLYDIVFHRLDDFAETAVSVQWHMFPESIVPKTPIWCTEEDFKDEACTEWDFDVTFSDSQSYMGFQQKPTRPEDMRMRNEITVHSSFYNPWHRDAVPSPTGLKVLDVPKGLIREGEDAQHYTEGQGHYEYQVWGRLPPGMRSDEEEKMAEQAERLQRSDMVVHSGETLSEELSDSDLVSECTTTT